MNETCMTGNAYDVCATDMNGKAEVSIGLFAEADTLTFTAEEWESFKERVETALLLVG